METKCECVVKNREIDESQRDWLKRCMCMHHWIQTDYYQDKELTWGNVLRSNTPQIKSKR